MGKTEKKERKKAITKSEKAELVFPVARVTTRMKTHWKRVSGNSGVYMASVLQFICSEILESATETTKNAGKRRITDALMLKSIRDDDDIALLFTKSGTMVNGQLDKISKAVTIAKKKDE